MKNFIYLYNGRSALNCALNNINFEVDDEILYPEFSCDVIFQSKPKINYNYKFYQIKDNFYLSIDLLKKKITKKTKVIIVINFFGIKQKLKKLYELCKRKKILLFVDECHTFYDLKKSSSNDCDIKFFSPSKIFDKILIGGILQINNNSINIKELPSYTFGFNFTKALKKKVKSLTLYEKIKFYNKRPLFENENSFKSKFIVKKGKLNNILINQIKSIDSFNENKLRLKNYKYWNKICKKLKIKPLLGINDINHGCPLYFPALCKSKNQASKIFDIGWKNKLEIVSWPTLHPIQKKNKRLITYWKKIVYFPMNKKYFNNQSFIRNCQN